MKKFGPDAHVGLLVKFLNNAITNEVNRNLMKFNLTAAQHEVLVYVFKKKIREIYFKKMLRSI